MPSAKLCACFSLFITEPANQCSNQPRHYWCQMALPYTQCSSALEESKQATTLGSVVSMNQGAQLKPIVTTTEPTERVPSHSCSSFSVALTISFPHFPSQPLINSTISKHHHIARNFAATQRNPTITTNPKIPKLNPNVVLNLDRG